MRMDGKLNNDVDHLQSVSERVWHKRLKACGRKKLKCVTERCDGMGVLDQYYFAPDQTKTDPPLFAIRSKVGYQRTVTFYAPEED